MQYGGGAGYNEYGQNTVEWETMICASSTGRSAARRRPACRRATMVEAALTPGGPGHAPEATAGAGASDAAAIGRPHRPTGPTGPHDPHAVGDWQCTRDNVNWAKRTQCHKCQRPRPQVAQHTDGRPRLWTFRPESRVLGLIHIRIRGTKAWRAGRRRSTGGVRPVILSTVG